VSSHNANSTLVNELRNDLTVIIGQCDMLEDAFATQADSLAHSRAIKAVALRMADGFPNKHCQIQKSLTGQKRERVLLPEGRVFMS
jgi:hypothetical protein